MLASRYRFEPMSCLVKRDGEILHLWSEALHRAHPLGDHMT